MMSEMHLDVLGKIRFYFYIFFLFPILYINICYLLARNLEFYKDIFLDYKYYNIINSFIYL